MRRSSSLESALVTLDDIEPPKRGMEDAIFRATFTGELGGRWYARENPRPVRIKKIGARQGIILAQKGISVNPFGLPFTEAVEFFRKKHVVSPEVFKHLKEAHRARAFTVKGLQDKYALESAREGILEALEKGLTERDFLEDLKEALESKGLGAPPSDWHLQTVFRTNTSTAYQAGHLVQMREMADIRPYWQYFTVGDDRVRPSHLRLHGVIRRADDPFWATWYPPNGYNCRCIVVSISEIEMEDEGLSVIAGPWTEQPDEGFRQSPVEWLGIAA